MAEALKRRTFCFSVKMCFLVEFFKVQKWQMGFTIIIYFEVQIIHRYLKCDDQKVLTG